MAYRIGIFDPAFRAEGHFVPFDRYIARLLDAEDIRVFFIDRDGAMKKAYENERFSFPHEYLELPSVPKPLPFLPGKFGRILARIVFWTRAFKMMRSSLDFVIFTADARDILMCVAPIRVPYGVIILHPYGYIVSGWKRAGARIRSFFYRRFVHRARIRITTNEPPILKGIQGLLGVTDIHWIPDVPAEARTHTGETRHYSQFLTIGTISKSKNHLFVLDAFAKARLPYSYKIAGKPLDAVGELVAERTKELKESGLSVDGYFGYLDEETYLNMMQAAEFLIFPYDLTRGNISSQVLHDAFSTETPFIAPDIEPFRWYANRYDIGILYAEGDADACARAVRTAHERGRRAFLEGFKRIQRDHALEAIRERFLNALRPILGTL